MSGVRNTLWNDFRMKLLYSDNALNHILAINGAVFILAGLLQLFSYFGMPFLKVWITYFELPSNPAYVLLRPWTIITYQFLHLGLFHLVFNLLVLSFAGRIFREFLGDKKLVATYLIGGFVGALFFVLAYQFLPMFSNKEMSYLLGASAGIMAILAAIGTLLPSYTISLMFIGPVKLVYIVLVLVLIDFLSVAGANGGGSIAHIGGAVWGMIYIKSLQNGYDLGKWVSSTLEYIQDTIRLFSRKSSKSNLKLRKSYTSYSKSVATTNGNSTSKTVYFSAEETITQDDIDRILDKINESGYDSLSQTEKDMLFKASKGNP